MSRILLGLSLFLSVSVWSQSPGNALSFDGTNDVVATTLPTVFTNISGSDFTIEFWISAQGSTTQRVMHAELNSTNFTSILLNTSNTVYFYVYNGGSSYSVTSDAGLTSAWTHVACVWEAATQTVSMYINGVLQSGSSGGSSSTATGNLMYLGAKTDGTQLLNAQLDEFRIWDYARNSCDISTSMVSEFDSLYSGLVVYYLFNEGTAGGNNAGITTLPDLSTNYNGTLTNFALNGATSNWVTSGAGITALNQGNGAVYNSIQDSICAGDPYVFGGQNLTVSGLYYDTLALVSGCDSIVELDLHVTNINNTVTINGITLQATQTGGTYQWLNCNTGNSPIAGAGVQYYTPVADGSYAVEINLNGCTDTSSCVTIVGVGLDENELSEHIKLYPNPTNGVIYLATDQNLEEMIIFVRSIDGKIIQQWQPDNQSVVTLEIEGEAGVYLIEVLSNGQRAVYKVSKE